MYKVDIFIRVNQRDPRVTYKEWSYCLEYKGRRLIDSGESHDSWNGANLQAITEALSRLTQSCDVTIHTEDKWLCNMAANNLEKWAENDFKNYKGEQISHAEKWRLFLQKSRTNRILMLPVELEDHKEIERRFA